MSNEKSTLDLLIEQTRKLGPQTQEDYDEQMVSFAYGNLKLSGWAGTKDDVRKALKELRQKP